MRLSPKICCTWSVVYIYLTLGKIDLVLSSSFIDEKAELPRDSQKSAHISLT